MRRKTIYNNFVILLVVGVLIFGVVTQFSSNDLGLPEIAMQDNMIKEAFLFAKEQPQLLEQIPCYCGCVNIGHRHNRDCYIDDNGEWVEHATLCGGCTSVTLDTKRLFLEGKSILEIRKYVDKEYGSIDSADSTHTPEING